MKPLTPWRRWWLLGGQWARGRLTATVCPSSINLPRLRWYWYDETNGFLDLSWGNGNSDPVWCVTVQVPVPARRRS
jgi:hypothetical protein